MKYYNPLFILALTLAPICHAGQLVYKPLNPSFGGNPLNGSFLLSKAQAQNKHKANLEQKSSADKLKESIERAYINKIVKEITNLAFGENPEDSIFNGNTTFTSGDMQVELITSSTDSITVQITNIITNEVTIIEVPRFG